MDKKEHVKMIIEAIGADVIMSHIEVGSSMIRRVRGVGEFPAKWFNYIDTCCTSLGIDCPRELFSFDRFDYEEVKQLNFQ